MANSDWFSRFSIPLEDGVNESFMWLSLHWRPYFQIAREPLAAFIEWVSAVLVALPPPLVLAALFLATWQLNGVVSAVCLVALATFVGMIGIWTEMMETLALILVAVALCLAVGLPLGLAAARSVRLDNALRPLLDLMQTLPAFVYLVPIVLLVGIGDLPGVLVTFVFAVPPTIRFTSLGIRGVPAPMVEAANALGASSRQVLFKVEVPQAMPSIVAGINQTIMMALAMVTYASMIGVGGLGRLVLRGIGRLDMGLATVGGIGIVALAIIFSALIRTSRRPAPGPAWLKNPRALFAFAAGNLAANRTRPARHSSPAQSPSAVPLGDSPNASS
ncbi:ABC transporter permease subunit [Acuticoccus sp. MNP-M23]|uniref:ABC transporter permease n=1 Tax=Acuticoccus sp. MNP-M23 TaxID=3072793 RepID=UPI002816781A|nr:ABC transporter permease subunit [Acuticoccus sp. MNP-M23]WMS41331.1 ABC transporter permease subunit [Acuticoccus sp. MNP-M23]